MDKFHLCSGFQGWMAGTPLEVVDMITWSKKKIGMGYRSRRVAEHLVVLQKRPRRAKGVWTRHDIPDVWIEPITRRAHTHQKPVGLQAALIEAVSNPGRRGHRSGGWLVLRAGGLSSNGSPFLGLRHQRLNRENPPAVPLRRFAQRSGRG